MKRRRTTTARRPPELRLELDRDEMILDSFAGGGGASSGLDMAFGRAPDIAVNHDPEAIAMHRANHPTTRHFVQDVFEVDIAKLCKGRRVGVAWFSPDCTWFSRARGAKPFRDRNKARRRRGLAGVVCKWAQQVRPRVIILENVSEFEKWGPLGDDNMPCKLREGLSFRRWWKQMENLGYVGEMRELKACDFGAPTTRKRLYIVFRCDGKPIVWPEPTHAPIKKPQRRPGRETLQPYVPASACIDWSIPCRSIFGRKKPLKPNTLRRIAKGIFKYVIDNPQPFIIPVTHHGDDRSHGVDQPLRTITAAHRGEQALVSPLLVRTAHGEQDKNGKRRGRGSLEMSEPYPTVTTSNDCAVVAPVLIQTSYGERKGQTPRVLDIHAPLGTVVAGGVKHSLCTAFLAKHFSERPTGGASLDKPVGTVTTKDHSALVTSHLLKLYGTAQAGAPVTDPMPTVTATGWHIAEVRAFLIKYFGTDQAPKLGDPLHTVTTKHRFGLVTVMIGGEEYAIVDIQMRMLEPHELAAAQGFKPGYVLNPKVKNSRGKMKPLTKTAQVRMIGNSVSPIMARAIARAQFEMPPAEQLGLRGVG